ncbi:MAG: hypothetical protein WBE60_06340 [Nitrosotalea sp.]
MQKAEKKRPVIDANGYDLSKKVMKVTEEKTFLEEIKQIMAENPRLYNALAEDKFD